MFLLRQLGVDGLQGEQQRPVGRLHGKIQGIFRQQGLFIGV